MNKQQIISLLKSLKLDAWKIVFTQNERCSLFYTKNGLLESGLSSNRLEATITIYKNYGKQIGDSSFTVHSDDTTSIKSQVKDALILCATAKKPSYPLSKPTAAKVELADQKIIDSFEKKSQDKLLIEIWNQLSVKTPSDVRIAACELSIGYTKTSITNSTGKTAKTQRTRFFIECPITAISREKELEYLASTAVIRLVDFNPSEFIENNSVKAIDVLHALNVVGSYTTIVLCADALRDFWSPDISTNPLIFHASARAKHMELSRFKKGEQIGNKFTLFSNPLLDYNPLSSALDFDGTKSARVKIVSNGKWNQMIASARYAHYLQIPTSGALGSVELECSEEFRELEGCVEIVSFSSFVPNGPSGDFSAEIRLGYLHNNAKKIPLRAAMFTGNLFKMLGSMKASKTSVILAGYKGPEKLLFSDGATLSGL